MHGLLGIVLLPLLCYLVSENRQKVMWIEVAVCVCIQAVIAVLFLKSGAVSNVFLNISHAIDGVRTATEAGTKFVFGYLCGTDTPFHVKEGASLFIFAFNALPMILVFSAMSMLAFHLGILQKFIQLISRIVRKVYNIGGALCLAASSKIVLGQTEAPLLIRPYLDKLSRSELMSLITCGFATSSGAGMLLYSQIIAERIPNAMLHILTVTIMSIPAAIVISRIIIPQTETVTDGDMESPYKFENSIEAISKGTMDGLGIVTGMAAMLIVTIAFITMINQCLSVLPNVLGNPITLQRCLGIIFAPLAYVIGIPFPEILPAGEMIATKIVVNEVIAFMDLIRSSLSDRSALITMYTLCNFGNISSIGMTVSAYSALAPTKNREVIGLCWKALFAATVASCLSASIVGIIVSV